MAGLRRTQIAASAVQTSARFKRNTTPRRAVEKSSFAVPVRHISRGESRAGRLATIEKNMLVPARKPAAATAPSCRAEQPPRAQTPRPELKPAKRSLSPAHDSLTYKAQYRFFASARNTAPQNSPRAQSLQPELKPAKRNIPPARNSLSYNTRRTPRRASAHKRRK